MHCGILCFHNFLSCKVVFTQDSLILNPWIFVETQLSIMESCGNTKIHNGKLWKHKKTKNQKLTVEPIPSKAGGNSREIFSRPFQNHSFKKWHKLHFLDLPNPKTLQQWAVFNYHKLRFSRSIMIFFVLRAFVKTHRWCLSLSYIL